MMSSDDVIELSPMNFTFIFCPNAVTNSIACFIALLLEKKLLFSLHAVKQGVIIFNDVSDNEHEVGGAQIRVEGVYIWPFRQLRMVANRYIFGVQFTGFASLIPLDIFLYCARLP